MSTPCFSNNSCIALFQSVGSKFSTKKSQTKKDSHIPLADSIFVDFLRACSGLRNRKTCDFPKITRDPDVNSTVVFTSTCFPLT